MIQTFKPGEKGIQMMITGSGKEVLHDFIALGAAVARMDASDEIKGTLICAFVTSFQEMTKEMEEEKNGSSKPARENSFAA